MKQHITIEQLNELDDIGKERLQDFCKKSDFETIRISKNGIKTMVKGTVLLSIGQMIEFFFESERFKELYIDDYYDYNINSYLDDNNFGIGWDGTELCDALWVAVKYILNN